MGKDLLAGWRDIHLFPMGWLSHQVREDLLAGWRDIHFFSMG